MTQDNLTIENILYLEKAADSDYMQEPTKPYSAGTLEPTAEVPFEPKSEAYLEPEPADPIKDKWSSTRWGNSKKKKCTTMQDYKSQKHLGDC